MLFKRALCDRKNLRCGRSATALLVAAPVCGQIPTPTTNLAIRVTDAEREQPLERTKKDKTIAELEKFLRLAPDSPYLPKAKAALDQLRKQK